MKEAATAPAGSHGAFWLPYLMGERTPHLDALGSRRMDRTDGEAQPSGPGARH